MCWSFRPKKQELFHRLLHHYHWYLLPGLLSAGAIALLSGLGAFQPLDHMAYRQLFRLRGNLAIDDRIVVVAIDEASLVRFGRFPWPRHHYVTLLDRLTQARAGVVAFDLIWSEPSADDAELAAAMTRQGRVVLAVAQAANGTPLQPVPMLQTSAIATGHILARQDADGLTRQVALHPSGLPFSYAAVQTYSLVHPSIQMPSSQQPLWLNWLSQTQHIPHYSFADVVAGTVPDAVFQDKIVLVGVTAIGFDPLITPFDYNPPTSGIYLHATAISNLLQRNALQVKYNQWIWLMLLLGGPGFSLCLGQWRSSVQVFCWLKLSLLWLSLSWVGLKFGLLLPIGLPILLLTLTTSLVALRERLGLNRLLQQQIQQIWTIHQQYLEFHACHSSQLVQWQTLPASMYRVAQLTVLTEQFGRLQSAQLAIAHSLSVGILASDLDGRVWFCNPAATRWLGVRIHEYLQLYLIPDWYQVEQWQADITQLQQQQVVMREVHCGDRWYALRIEPLFYQNRDATPPLNPPQPADGLLLLLEEITEQKQAIAELASLQQQLKSQRMQLDEISQYLAAVQKSQ
ncbi:CHASE2 domain-containing protein [Oculatella sp. LEGE 06141]|uniref:CHASE2 domain-containing protein n=1 Tax=Oculatella sp. LEGE 06141 TaxID=1828648 RepID=UPI00187EB0B3|nr:CHASE2 domain-containing protein [Oculatella sp. LEGE 06141]MBE9180356.1 CHASE2 domain-containing protein [Oculatella sp. LEGE 06141]